MKQLLLVIVLLYFSLLLSGQDKPTPDNLTKVNPAQEAKTKMVLRSNSRDQVIIIRDNQHRNQSLQRNRSTIQHQQMMVRKRMHKVQRQRVIRQNMQKRRMRQQINRTQQQHHRRR